MSSSKTLDSSSLDLKKDPVFQAVIIADSYDEALGPLSSNYPKCLLPLGNRPLIHHTLESCRISGVQEALVYSSKSPSLVRKSIEGSNFESMNVKVIANEDCLSFGDAMRDLDGKGLLRHDFVLMSGDTICNVELKPILDHHKNRCKSDKNAVMTLVYKNNDPGHHHRTEQEEIIVALTPENRVVYYKKNPGKKFEVPLLQLVQEFSEFDIRYNLVDPCIAMCTPAVPPLFSDNFDCQTMDRFIGGILVDELISSTIYSYEIIKGYAARLNNFHNYLSLSTDLMSRWVFPIVPENCSEGTNFSRHNIYRSNNVNLQRGSILNENVILGPRVVIGTDSFLSDVCLGEGVNIGREVKLENVIVHKGAKIGDFSDIKGSVIGSDVIVESRVTIKEKCALGPGTVVPTGLTIPVGTFLSETYISKDEDDDLSDLCSKKSQDCVKYGPKAFVFEASNEDSDEEENDSKVPLDIWGLCIRSDESEESFSEEESEVSDLEANEEDFMNEDDYNYELFKKEIFDSISRGADEGVKTENLILEINSSKHAYNMTLSQVNNSIINSILKLESNQELSGAKLLLSVKTSLQGFKSLLENYIKSVGAQRDVLFALETYATEQNSQFIPILSKIIHHLYDKDLLNSEIILEWFSRLENEEIRVKVQPLINWLEETDSEED